MYFLSNDIDVQSIVMLHIQCVFGPNVLLSNWQGKFISNVPGACCGCVQGFMQASVHINRRLYSVSACSRWQSTLLTVYLVCRAWYGFIESIPPSACCHTNAWSRNIWSASKAYLYERLHVGADDRQTFPSTCSLQGLSSGIWFAMMHRSHHWPRVWCLWWTWAWLF